MEQRMPLPADESADAPGAALVVAVANEPGVVAAWLFGSVARGTAGPLSDVDVALALAPGADREAVCGRIVDRLARRLRTDRIDLVPIDEASIALRHRIIRDGRRLVCRDRAACERLAVDAVMRYLDFQPVREIAFRQMRDAITEGK
jgi:uncharacterized protein